MPDNFSTHLHYYVLLSLFALLFFLQIWAMIKIKLMLQRVLDIYKRMQQIAAMSKSGLIAEGGLQPSPLTGVKYKRICEWCRHRETFLDPSGNGVFVYRCGLSKYRIKLDDSCPKFEFDPQRTPI